MSTVGIQPGWFSIPGAAKYTGFSVSAIRTAIDSGKLKRRSVPVAEGSTKPSIRIKRDDLDRWIEGENSEDRSCLQEIFGPSHPMSKEPELLTPTELAKALKVGTATISRWRANGIITPEICVGRVYRFDEAKVRASLAERAKKGAKAR